MINRTNRIYRMNWLHGINRIIGSEDHRITRITMSHRIDRIKRINRIRRINRTNRISRIRTALF